MNKILLLGDEGLYGRCEEVQPGELKSLRVQMEKLYNVVVDFKGKNGWGDAISAPQIGLKKRMICMNLAEPTMIINPVLEFPEKTTYKVAENCISAPGLWVRIERYRQCILHYRNADWIYRQVLLEDDLAYLIQHMVDHLDGIMPTMRAVDEKAFYSKKPPQIIK